MHRAAKILSSSLYEKIAAIVTIGDPFRDDRVVKSLEGKRLTVCNDGDLICEGLPFPWGEHEGSAYVKRVAEMVRFIQARV